MSSKRCDLCGLFGCHHVNPRLEPRHGSRSSNALIPFGEKTVTPIGFEGNTALADDRHSTIPGPGPGTVEQQRILIPPPPAVPNLPGVVQVSKELQKIDTKDDWVHCNLCKARVNVQYLDNHLKVHTDLFEPSKVTSQTSSTSTAIVPVTSSVSTTVSPNKKDEKIPTLSKVEKYKFRELVEACCASSVSLDGRYSDFTVVFWEKDKPGVQTTTYTGGATTYTTREWERLSIHVVYDNVEDYFTVSCKLLKRSGYSTFDTEDAIPDRICFQEELITEIKRALLFYKISPDEALKKFTSLFTQPIIIDHDAEGRALIAQTQNCDVLQERLKRISSYSGYDHAYD